MSELQKIRLGWIGRLLRRLRLAWTDEVEIVPKHPLMGCSICGLHCWRPRDSDCPWCDRNIRPLLLGLLWIKLQLRRLARWLRP